MIVIRQSVAIEACFARHASERYTRFENNTLSNYVDIRTRLENMLIGIACAKRQNTFLHTSHASFLISFMWGHFSTPLKFSHMKENRFELCYVWRIVFCHFLVKKCQNRTFAAFGWLQRLQSAVVPQPHHRKDAVSQSARETIRQNAVEAAQDDAGGVCGGVSGKRGASGKIRTPRGFWRGLT